MTNRVEELKHELADAKDLVERLNRELENATRAKAALAPRLESAEKQLTAAQSEFGRVAVRFPGSSTETAAREKMVAAQAALNQAKAEISAVESAAHEVLETTGVSNRSAASGRVSQIEREILLEATLAEIRTFDPKVLEPLYRAWALDPRSGHTFPSWFAFVFATPYMVEPFLNLQRQGLERDKFRGEMCRKYGVTA